jgi:hypothetical protein
MVEILLQMTLPERDGRRLGKETVSDAVRLSPESKRQFLSK